MTSGIPSSARLLASTVLVRPKDPIVNLWCTEELRQEHKNIQDLCRGEFDRRGLGAVQGHEEGVNEERPESRD